MSTTDPTSVPETPLAQEIPTWSTRRNPDLTRQKTREAALKLLGQGEWPSRTRVLAITKRGSTKDVEQHLKQFFIDIHRTVEQTPDDKLLRTTGLPSKVLAAVHVLLDTLRDEASERLKRELVEAERRADDAQQRALESERQRGQTEDECEALRRELARLEELRDQLKRQVDDEIVDRRRAERKLAKLNGRLMIRRPGRKRAPIVITKKSKRNKSKARGRAIVTRREQRLRRKRIGHKKPTRSR